MAKGISELRAAKRRAQDAYNAAVKARKPISREHQAALAQLQKVRGKRDRDPAEIDVSLDRYDRALKAESRSLAQLGDALKRLTDATEALEAAERSGR